MAQYTLDEIMEMVPALDDDLAAKVAAAQEDAAETQQVRDGIHNLIAMADSNASYGDLHTAMQAFFAPKRSWTCPTAPRSKKPPGLPASSPPPHPEVVNLQTI